MPAGFPLGIKITGPAGLGINSTAEVIASLSANLGYEVITDIEYESRIKGGSNYFDIFIAPNRKYLSKKVDIILSFDAKSLDYNIHTLKNNGVIIINQKFREKINTETYKTIESKNIQILDLKITDKYDNTYLLGILSKLLSIPHQAINNELQAVFGKKGADIVEKNKEIIKKISHSYTIDFDYAIHLKNIGDAKNIEYGNKMLAHGAIECGLEYYSAYPMTPASTILSEIIASKKVNYLQAEDEISVINSALGASFTGARSMVGTSGGGFALMTEAVSFAVQAEFPITIVFSQRAGPSTGTPTFFEQGDLNFALNPTFGDFDHIVLYPSTLEEAYYFGGLALNLADKYQTQVIILMDKQSSELNGTLGKLNVPEIERGVILNNPPQDYKRYELTDTGVSPRVHVGTKNGDFIASSYEHDEYGATSEDPKVKVAMTQKRFKKLENFYKKENISGYEIINSEAKKMIITTSFTSYTANEFIKNNSEFGLITITILKPLDERLLEEIKNKKEVIFVESNYSGQLENYITKEFGLKYIKGLKISNLRKYDLFPFYIEDFNELI
ncbi:hypothetical protein A9Q91_00955 [Candidatus Gracilibacteria bacterium 28_42_T64]|nr:hypothetical protein A9Q91_00955 [Candidatus Gracilibacteria bacterium 28_42_T64]